MSFSESKSEINQDQRTEDSLNQEEGQDVMVDTVIPIENPQDFLVTVTKSDAVEAYSSQEQEFKIQNQASPEETAKNFHQRMEDLRQNIFTKVNRIKEDSITEIKMSLNGGAARIKEDPESFFGAHSIYGFRKLDSGVARYLLRNGHTKDLLDNLWEFEDLDSDIALTLIDNVENGENVVYYHRSFKEFKYDEIGNCLLKKGSFKVIAEHMSSFPLINNKKIADTLVSTGQLEVLARSMDQFADLNDKEYAKKILDAGLGKVLAENLFRFHDLDPINVANRLIEEGQFKAIADNVGLFHGLSSSIAEALMNKGFKYEVAKNLSSFKKVNYHELASYLINNKDADILVEHLGYYSGLDNDMAFSLINEGFRYEVAENLSSFQGVDYTKLASYFLNNNGEDILAEYLYNFCDLDNDVALSLIDMGYAKAVMQSTQVFPYLEKDIVKEAILSDYNHSFGSPIPFLNKLSNFGFSDEEQREIYQLFWAKRTQDQHEITPVDAEDAINLASCMNKRNQPAEIKWAREIFGELLSLENFICVRSLFNNEPPNADLQILGINETGNSGLIKLKNISSELLKSFNTCIIGESDLNLLEKSKIAREMLSMFSGFQDGIWGERDDYQLLKKIRLVQRLNSEGLYRDYHSNLEPSEVYEIRKLDSRENKEGFSEDVLKKYTTLRNDLFGAIDAVNTKGGMGKIVEEIRSGIGQILNTINFQITTIDPLDERAKKKRENLERKREELEQYLQTIDVSTRRNPNIPLDIQARFVVQSPKIFVRGLPVLSKYEELYSPIRKLVFAGALKKFNKLNTPLSKLEETPKIADLCLIKEFVDHTVSEEMYGEYFFGDNKLAKMFNKISNTEALENGIGAYFKNAPRVGKSRIKFVPTRGLMLEMSGQIADACWADKYESVGEQMPNMSVIIMKARPGEKTERVVGAALLIDTFSPRTKERVLLLRGVNPRQNYINTVDSKEFFNAITDYLVKTAHKRGMIPAVVIDDHQGGAGTNRPALYRTMAKMKKDLTIIPVNGRTTFFNGYDVTDCSFRLD